jgi:hypothetical protein
MVTYSVVWKLNPRAPPREPITKYKHPHDSLQ